MSLDDIAAATRIQRELLEGLENNNLSGWPQGLYARAWIRAYATVVGLDPADTVDDFCRLYPHGDRRLGGTIQEIAAIVAAPSEYRDEFPHAERRRPPADSAVAAGEMELEAEVAPARQAPLPWYAPVLSAVRPLWIRIAALSPAPKRLRRGLP
jgi:hypothetical protein